MIAVAASGFYLRIMVTVVLCRHDTKVKPEAATAVIELLMMTGKLPKRVEL